MNLQFNRRHFLAAIAPFGVAHTLFPGALLGVAEAQAARDKGRNEPPRITKEMIDNAAAIAGVHIDEGDKEMMLDNLNNALTHYEAIHNLHLPNEVPPAFVFQPILSGMNIAAPTGPTSLSPAPTVTAPRNLEDVAFYSVRQLAELIRARRISSHALTQMYLERLKRYDPILKFIVTLTEERALAQAKQADRDLAAGRYRGVLHGLPWGAKDLLAVQGYKTTWGAGGFENQQFDTDATVVKRLDEAGAVLVAKLTLGALAMGDVWFGGTTRNPWKTDQGSSGSSAGSASATAAGCVAFAIGTETLGSIASPSARCGTTGLRPTFGRVPRTGAMALSWTMDKIGPICRAVEDCAVVLEAIQGPDGHDGSVNAVPYAWNASLDIHQLRIGYLKDAFEDEPNAQDDKDDPAKRRARELRLERKRIDDAALAVLQHKLGLKLVPVKMPDFHYEHLYPILNAEAAAAFDELTRSGRDKLLTAQKKGDWPNTFRSARFTPAVEYINANRARTLGMQAMAKLFETVDVIVCPTFGSQLVATNFTGHPALILPHGFRSDGTPTSLTFLGNLYREDQLCAVAKAYQDATEWNQKHPEKIEATPEKSTSEKP